MYIVSAPGTGKCKVCAMRHDRRLPHDTRSVYYIVRFVQKHGREPNWKDAMEHCSEAIKTNEYRKRGEVYGMDQNERQTTNAG